MDIIRFDHRHARGERKGGVIVGFDALRAFGALAVVALHAGVPYLKHPMPGLIWPVRDAGSNVVDALFWGIEVMIMPLFLMMTGYLMWQSSRRLTPGRLIRSRFKRLIIPLAFGVLVILPIDLLIWTLGLVTDGVVPPIKLRSFKFAPPVSEQIWGLSHLWFLLYVFLYVVVAGTLLKAATWAPAKSLSKRVFKPKVVAMFLGCTAVTTLMAAPEIVWGFQHAFLPVPSKWLYSGVFFAAGCALAFYDPELQRTAKSVPHTLGFGMVMLMAAVLMGTWFLRRIESADQVGLAHNLLLSMFTIAAAASITTGLIGAAVRWIKRVPHSISYLAAASFWIYIVHHPLLGLIHTHLKTVWGTGFPVVKLMVSFSLTVVVLVLMYETMIRKTWLGRVLGFAHLNHQAPTQSTADFDTTDKSGTEKPVRRAA